MGLSGSLRTLSLADILQTLHRSQASGVLHLSSVEGRCDITFSAGSVVDFARHDDRVRFSLAERLIAMGVLERSAAASALTPRSSGNFTTVSRLVEEGAIERATADDALGQYLADEVCNLFTWESANFVFREAGDQPVVAPADVRVEVPALLMESARLTDDWERIRDELPPDEVVVVALPGSEQALAEFAAAYPGSTVLPLVDGARTIADIIAESPATRMQVHFLLHQLVAEGLLRVLSIDEMEDVGRQLLACGEYERASRLLQACLALDAEPRPGTMQTLAEAVERLDGGPRAGRCFGQLALSLLQEGRYGDALPAARRAVELCDDSDSRLVLVRCYIEAEDVPAAVQELLVLARQLADVGRLDDARSTCLKALELDAGNTEVRHELSRIHAMSLDDDQAVDLVVCVECGETSPRDKDRCGHCGASLQLRCLSCDRVVGVSDRVCVFCGADPHRSGESRVQRVQSGQPGTTTVINAESVRLEVREAGTEKWQSEMRAEMEAARAFELEGRLAEALRAWKAVAHKQHGNPQLTQHIRDLEALVHDEFVELTIERAHRLRRGRSFWRAYRAYRRALHSISPQDPRAGRLQALVRSTRRSAHVIGGIYTLALSILAVVAWLVVEPQLALRALRQDVAEARREMEAALEHPGQPQRFLELRDLPDAFVDRAERFGEEGRRLVDQLLELRQTLRIAFAHHQVEEAERLVAAGEVAAARDLLRQIDVVFGPEVFGKQRSELSAAVAEAERSRQQRESLLERAPDQLAEARQLVADGRLAEAMAVAVEVAGSGHAEVAGAAQELVAELAARRDALEQALGEVEALLEEHLVQARARLDELRDDARSWAREAEVEALDERIGERLAASRAAYERLGANAGIDELQAFVEAHPAGPEASAARLRLEQLEAGAEERRAVFARGLEAYREARRREHWRTAWEVGRDLAWRFPAQAREAGIELPFLVETGRAGVALVVDDRRVGTSGPDGRILWHRPPDRRIGSLSLRAPGFEEHPIPPVRLEDDWRYEVALERSLRWSWSGNGPVLRLASAADLLVVVDGARLVALDDAGRERWRADVGVPGNVGWGGQPSWSHVAVDDQVVLAPLGDGGLAVLDRDGNELASVPGEPLVDRPVSYFSELLGEHRLAAVDGTLRMGSLEGLHRFDPGVQLLRGPVVRSVGIERLLVVATVDGRLLVVDEAARRIAGELELAATDVGPLLPVDDAAIVTVLDGGRLVCVDTAGGSLAVRWEARLQAPAAGDPAAAGGRIAVAAGDRVALYEPATGRVLRELALPAPAVVGAVLGGGAVACAYRSTGETGVVRCWDEHALRWQRTFPSSVRALAMTPGAVIVGLADGSVHALEP